MNLKGAIKIVEDHNKWRQDFDSVPVQDQKQVTEVINVLIKSAKKEEKNARETKV